MAHRCGHSETSACQRVVTLGLGGADKNSADWRCRAPARPEERAGAGAVPALDSPW